MKRLQVLVIVLLVFMGCQTQPDPTQFSETALQDSFQALDGTSIEFSELLQNYQGKTVLIDVWASWCRDCLVGFPKLKALQAQHQEVVFVYLSLDKSIDSWKKGIKTYNLDGEHYYMSSGWDGPFGDFLDLDWIPRYLVIDKTGNITVFRSIRADDPKLELALQ